MVRNVFRIYIKVKEFKDLSDNMMYLRSFFKKQGIFIEFWCCMKKIRKAWPAVFVGQLYYVYSDFSRKE